MSLDRTATRMGRRLVCFAVVAALFSATVARAQDKAKEAVKKSPSELALEQQQIAEKYKRFEEVLMRMAELTAPTDPKRAALLRKAVAESKQQLISLQLDRLVELLDQDRLSAALTNQNDVNKDLQSLLELLLSEQREKGLKDERKRLQEQIRKIRELINKERQLQGETAGDGNADQLGKRQGDVAGQAGKLAKEMKEANEKKSDQAGEGSDAPGSPSGESEPMGDKQDPNKSQGEDKEKDKDKGKGESENKEGDAEKKPSESENKEGETGKSEGQPSEGQPSEGKPSEGQSSEGKSSPSGKGEGKSQGEGQGEPQEGQEQGEGQQENNSDSQQNRADSARKRVEAAQKKMELARQKLEKAQRSGAVEDQEQAIRELEQAKAELEEILRQLREEELARTLAMLEARFRKMLEAQLFVYEGTKRLDRVPAEERGPSDEIESSRLGRKESQIVLEADSALSILREEGTAVAFHEAVDQMRDDMSQVVERLSAVDVGQVTQGIEEDIIAALEEMIEALAKAQQEMEDKKQQGQPQEGEPQDPQLIDTIAQLKLIRSLQLRVNTRTKRFSRLVEEGEIGQADRPELLEQLEHLAEREASIHRVTRDIVTGRNR